MLNRGVRWYIEPIGETTDRVDATKALVERRVGLTGLERFVEGRMRYIIPCDYEFVSWMRHEASKWPFINFNVIYGPMEGSGELQLAYRDRFDAIEGSDSDRAPRRLSGDPVVDKLVDDILMAS